MKQRTQDSFFSPGEKKDNSSCDILRSRRHLRRCTLLQRHEKVESNVKEILLIASEQDDQHSGQTGRCYFCDFKLI